VVVKAGLQIALLLKLKSHDLLKNITDAAI